MYTDPSQHLAVMSIAFLLSHRDDAIVWRGPKKNGTYKMDLLCLLAGVFQFYADLQQ